MAERPITGTHPKLVREPATPAAAPDAASEVAMAQGNSDLDLLPRRFEFFASEMRDFVATTRAFIVPKLARIEDEILDARRYGSQQWNALHARVDRLEGKLDEILQAVRTAKGSES